MNPYRTAALRLRRAYRHDPALAWALVPIAWLTLTLCMAFLRLLALAVPANQSWGSEP